MKGYDDSLKHGKRFHFLSNIHLISFSEEGFLNYLQKPNIQKFKNNFSAALKLLYTIVSGHKHSPGDAGQGEEYPGHLVDLDYIYKMSRILFTLICITGRMFVSRNNSGQQFQCG